MRILISFDTIFRLKMKVFMCLFLLAAIAAAIPVKNPQESHDVHKTVAGESARALSLQLTASEPKQIFEDLKTQTENSNRDKRFLFFGLLPSAVYVAPAPILYSAPVVETVVRFEHIVVMCIIYLLCPNVIKDVNNHFSIHRSCRQQQ